MKPQIRVKQGETIGVDVFIRFPDLTGNEITYLSADEALGQTTLSVDSGKNFTANDYGVVGTVKDENAELRAISGQSDTTLTTDALDYAHGRGTPITYIPFNKWVVSYSTDGTTYSVLSAVDINPQLLETVIHRTADASTYYYKVRGYNSTTGLYTDYSDAVIATGYADNTVHSIKKRALDDLGESVGDTLTDEWLNQVLWEGRRELANDKRVRRFSWRRKTNEDIGDCMAGHYYISLPSDLLKKTNENILSIRIGKDNSPLTYLDINEMNEYYRDIAKTTLNGAVLAADTSIILTSSGDFESSGSIDIASASVSGTIDSVAYTGITTDTLTGVTGIATGGHADGAIVWQGASFGMPQYYTIDTENSRIIFDCPFSDDEADYNIFMDYFYSMPSYDSDADALDEPEYDMYVPWLKWKVKYKRSGGKIMQNSDPDYLDWVSRKDALISKEYTGQKIRFVPKI